MLRKHQTHCLDKFYYATIVVHDSVCTPIHYIVREPLVLIYLYSTTNTRPLCIFKSLFLLSMTTPGSCFLRLSQTWTGTTYLYPSPPWPTLHHLLVYQEDSVTSLPPQSAKKTIPLLPSSRPLLPSSRFLLRCFESLFPCFSSSTTEDFERISKYKFFHLNLFSVTTLFPIKLKLQLILHFYFVYFISLPFTRPFIFLTSYWDSLLP